MGTFITEIENYWVSTYRSTRRAPLGMHLYTLRTLRLTTKVNGYGNGLRQANISFVDDDVFNSNFRDFCGFRRSETFLEGYLPISDYGDYYKILQSESPVYFLWHELSESSGIPSVQILQITTFDEPLGEGPSELSVS